MLVFWKEKLVLLAVPKTASTAYETALAPIANIVVNDPPLLKHSPLYRYHRFFKPMLEDIGGQKMETLAVIRDPIDWLGSWYRFRSRPILVGTANSTASISFDAFVSAYMQEKKPDFAKVGSQAKFVARKDGSVGVTHLFAYEDQPALLTFLEQRLNTRISLSRFNVSPKRDLVLSAEVEAQLRQTCAPEFAVWQQAKNRIGKA